MNGAQSVIATLAVGGVEVFFANPGTSELHLLAALDRQPEARCVPVLFEGVATGAADGYARLAGKPACALLHLGPGLANGLANLHNASRARVPLVNLIGQHPTGHLCYATPLRSDVESLARPYSVWLRTTPNPASAGADAAEALAAARRAPGRIATLVVPADAAWGEGGCVATPAVAAPAQAAEAARIEEAVRRLRARRPAALLLGGNALHGPGLRAAGRVARASGARLLAPYPLPRLERGAGLPRIERIPYVLEQAIERLRDLRTLVLVGAPPPRAYFAYPDKESRAWPGDCEIYDLAPHGEDEAATMAALAEALVVGQVFTAEVAAIPAAPRGAITLAGVAQAVAATLPEGAVVIDESMTSGRGLMAATQGCPRHDWLANTGGSIGIALPLATGAAIAEPKRPVLCFSADGCAAYTLQALWTMARESLRVTTILFANHRYGILEHEFRNLGLGEPGPAARACLELRRPKLEWIQLARGFGVPARCVASLEDLAQGLTVGYGIGGPSLLVVNC